MTSIRSLEFPIGLTDFFQSWENYQDIYQILEKKITNNNSNSFRFWVVPNLLGQDAYSLAILMNELKSTYKDKNIRFDIFATDSKVSNLDFAKLGRYPNDCLNQISNYKAEWIPKYFDFNEDFFEVKSFVKDNIHFINSDIIEDPPFLFNDLIIARNLLIQYDFKLHEKILSILNLSLASSGLLYLGNKNILIEENGSFSTNDSLINDIVTQQGWGNLFQSESPDKVITNFLENDSKFCHFIINNNQIVFEILGFSSPFIQIPVGRISNKILEVIHPNLFGQVNNLLKSYSLLNDIVISPIFEFNSERYKTYVRLYLKPFFIKNTSKKLILTIEIIDENELEQFLKSNIPPEVNSNAVNIITSPFVQNYQLSTLNSKKLQSLLSQTEAELASILMNNSNIIILLDENMNVIRFNEYAKRTYNFLNGTNLEINQKFLKFIDTKQFDHFVSEFNRAVNGEIIQNGISLIAQNGSTLWYKYSLTPVYLDGRITRVSFSMFDITDIKLNESRIFTLAQNFKNTIQNVVGVVFKFRKREDGEFVYIFNDGEISKKLGYTTDKVAGRTLRDVVGSEEADQLMKTYNKAIEENGLELEFTFQNRSYFSKILPDYENGKVVGVIGSAIDVTEKNILEQKLHQTQKLETIGYLATGIAHDFNNLLQPIMNYTKLLKKDLENFPNIDPNLSLEKIMKILHSLDLAKSIVNQILTFSKQGDQRNINNLSLNIYDSIEKVKSILNLQIPDTIEKIIYVQEEMNPYISISELEIEQILLNLISNSLESTSIRDKPQIKIQILDHFANQDKAVTVLGEITNPGIYFIVSDNGSGVDPEDLKSIFDPFYSKKITNKDSGTGLGLSIIYGITKRLNGCIQVYSVPNQGSEFSIFFPNVEKNLEEIKTSVSM